MELRSFPHLPFTPSELQLRDQLASLAKTLNPSTSDFTRRVDSLASDARLLQQATEREEGTGGRGRGVGGGGALDLESLDQLRGLLGAQAEAMSRLSGVVEKDARDLEIMAGGGQRGGREKRSNLGYDV